MSYLNMDPDAAQAAIQQTRGLLEEQFGNTSAGLANHEGTRARFTGMAGRSYEHSFVTNHDSQTTHGQFHTDFHTDLDNAVTNYRTGDEINADGFNGLINPS
jgi:hypothetical protein